MQVFQPWIQNRRISYAKHKHVIAGILKHLSVRALGRLLTDDGEPNTTVIERLATFTLPPPSSDCLWIIFFYEYAHKNKS